MKNPISTGRSKADHFEETVDHFALIGSEDLHFTGYYQQDTDDLVTSLRNLNELIAQTLNLRESDHLLDVGCGTGGASCYLAETRRCRVTGVDMGETQLAAARQLAARKGLADRTTFLREDATDLSLTAGVYDAVLLLGTAFHVEDKTRLFAECGRVAKPGSRLVVLDFFINQPELYEDRKTLRQRQILDAFFGHPVFATPDRYLEDLRSAGYTVSESRDLGTHVIRSCEGWKLTLEAQCDHAIEVLGKPRYLSILIAARTLKQMLEQDLLAGLMMSAIRS